MAITIRRIQCGEYSLFPVLILELGTLVSNSSTSKYIGSTHTPQNSNKIMEKFRTILKHKTLPRRHLYKIIVEIVQVTSAIVQVYNGTRVHVYNCMHTIVLGVPVYRVPVYNCMHTIVLGTPQVYPCTLYPCTIVRRFVFLIGM